MKFYVAIVIAAIVAWLAGAVWYMALGKPWMAALGRTPGRDGGRESGAGRVSAVRLCVRGRTGDGLDAGRAFCCISARAFRLTIRSGIITGAFCWFGFVITTMLVNNSFARRDWRLLLIDGGHWLIVLLLMGAVIGAIGF